jgi:hypothetical protein
MTLISRRLRVVHKYPKARGSRGRELTLLIHTVKGLIRRMINTSSQLLRREMPPRKNSRKKNSRRSLLKRSS